MKAIKRIILVALSSLGCALASAQNVDSLFVDARGSFIASDGVGVLAPEYFNVHVFGSLNEHFNYRIRQRLNVPIDSYNPFKATDWMCLFWKPNDRLRLYAGKSAILIGGYEYDSAPADVYFYSLFCNNLSQGFAFSVGGEYEFAPGQTAAVQICNSPLVTSYDNRYAYNFAWMGSFAPWWKTIWTYNIVEDPQGRRMQYLALGNHCVWDGLAVDIDLYNRASAEQKHYLLSDFSLISKVIWSVGKWNICAKTGFETNAADNVLSSGAAYDTVVPPGTEYWYGGCGLEYFPAGNDRIRLHLAGFTDTLSQGWTVTTGVKWRFDIIRH